MSEDKVLDAPTDELTEDEAALENMEATLKEMHGDESYDDTDQDEDKGDEEETNEEAQGQDTTAQADKEDSGQEAGDNE